MPTLARSLRNLFSEIDDLWPNRDRRTDGWYRAPKVGLSVGHNPGARGLVHAIDVDVDGLWPPYVLDRCKRIGIVRYYIWNRKIYHVRDLYQPDDYDGVSPHTDHMHIEIEQTVHAEEWSGWWQIGAQRGLSTPGGGGQDNPGQPAQPPSQGFGAADPRDHRSAIIATGEHLLAVGGYLDGHAAGAYSTTTL